MSARGECLLRVSSRRSLFYHLAVCFRPEAAGESNLDLQTPMQLLAHQLVVQSAVFQ